MSLQSRIIKYQREMDKFCETIESENSKLSIHFTTTVTGKDKKPVKGSVSSNEESKVDSKLTDAMGITLDEAMSKESKDKVIGYLNSLKSSEDTKVFLMKSLGVTLTDKQADDFAKSIASIINTCSNDDTTEDMLIQVIVVSMLELCKDMTDDNLSDEIKIIAVTEEHRKEFELVIKEMMGATIPDNIIESIHAGLYDCAVKAAVYDSLSHNVKDEDIVLESSAEIDNAVISADVEKKEVKKTDSKVTKMPVANTPVLSSIDNIKNIIVKAGYDVVFEKRLDGLTNVAVIENGLLSLERSFIADLDSVKYGYIDKWFPIFSDPNVSIIYENLQCYTLNAELIAAYVGGTDIEDKDKYKAYPDEHVYSSFYFEYSSMNQLANNKYKKDLVKRIVTLFAPDSEISKKLVGFQGSKFSMKDVQGSKNFTLAAVGLDNSEVLIKVVNGVAGM